mmetsp:Transcript_12670/g.46801  ORF Transcript_12670/g.46801 Transcript_12670/m.46801 type:complete len:221 (-) Transcript_12670:664-1326(-)
MFFCKIVRNFLARFHIDGSGDRRGLSFGGHNLSLFFIAFGIDISCRSFSPFGRISPTRRPFRLHAHRNQRPRALVRPLSAKKRGLSGTSSDKRHVNPAGTVPSMKMSLTASMSPANVHILPAPTAAKYSPRLNPAKTRHDIAPAMDNGSVSVRRDAAVGRLAPVPTPTRNLTAQSIQNCSIVTESSPNPQIIAVLSVRVRLLPIMSASGPAKKPDAIIPA